VAEPTIAAGYPKGFLEFAVSRGADRKALMTSAGLAEADLAQQDNRVSLPRYVALIRAAIAQLNEPAIALQFGEAVRMQDISIVGLICEAAATPNEVGVQLNRYARLVVDESPGRPREMVRSVIQKDGIWMEAVPGFFQDPLITEAEFARLVWNTRTMFAADPLFQAMPFPKAMHFRHEGPNYRAEYDRIFGVPVTFGSDRDGLLLDPRFVLLRQPPMNRYVFGVLSERADALLKELEASKTVRARVESQLLPILHTGDATMDRIAAQLGLSRRTLLRKLSAEGTTFEKVLDELRHRLALDFLAGNKVSINVAAYLVGFSDPAAFSRAFKRWTGSSPRRHRSEKR
jgi:AraC-like DNA-binding protein